MVIKVINQILEAPGKTLLAKMILTIYNNQMHRKCIENELNKIDFKKYYQQRVKNKVTDNKKGKSDTSFIILIIFDPFFTF